jgi:tetrahydromethanopterin S-methyltransferase subunit B
MADITQKVVTKVIIDNKEAVNALGNQEKAQEEVAKATGETEEATQEMTGALDGMASSLGINVGAMKKSVGGLGTMVKGFKSLRVAIAATGIGLLIVALGSLFSWFNKTAEGQEKLAVITATLGEVFNQLSELAVSLGSSLFKAFEDPKKAVTNLWETIKTNLINRVKAIPILFTAIGKTIKAALDLDFNKVKEGAKEVGTAVVQLNTGLDETQQKDILGSIADKTKEIAENINSATEIQKDSNKLRRDQIAFITREAELERDISEARRVANDEASTLQEQQAAILEAERLAVQIADERRVLLAAELKQLEDKNALGSNTLEDIEAEEQLKKQIINLDRQANDLLKSLSRRKTTINNQIEAENTAKEKGAEIDSKIDEKEAERSAKADEKLVIAKEKAAEERALELENAQMRADALILIEEDRLARQLELAKGNEAEIELAKFESSQRIAKIEKDSAKKTKSISDQTKKNEVDNAQSIADSSISALQAVFGENKTLASAAALVNGALAITKILGQTGIAAPPAIAASIVTTETQIATIQKASKGLMIEGNSHAHGGVKMMTPSGMIEAEGGEFIMNKASTAMFKDELNAISLAGGGVPLAERGMMIEGASRQSNASNLSNDITNAVNNQQTVLVTEDLDIVQSRVRVTEDIATL